MQHYKKWRCCNLGGINPFIPPLSTPLLLSATRIATPYIPNRPTSVWTSHCQTLFINCEMEKACPSPWQRDSMTLLVVTSSPDDVIVDHVFPVCVTSALGRWTALRGRTEACDVILLSVVYVSLQLKLITWSVFSGTVWELRRSSAPSDSKRKSARLTHHEQ